MFKVPKNFKIKNKETYKALLDSKDRDILRLLYAAERNLSGNAIADKVGLSPPAIKPRLENLENIGIVKKVHIGENRSFERKFPQKDGTTKDTPIKSPSKIMWGLDLKKEEKQNK